MLFKGTFISSLIFLSLSCDKLGIPNPVANKQTNSQLSAIQENQQTILAKISKLEKEVKNLAQTIQKQGGALAKTQRPQTVDANKVYNIEIGDSYVHGNKDAPVTIIKWLDFQCPYCARSVAIVDEISKKYKDKVRFVFKNFPLPFHKQAKAAAKYSLAAEKQGKYLEMYHKIFENYKNLKKNQDYPLEIAKELGLNLEQFKKDFTDPALDKKIEIEIAQMRNSGIPRMSVPKFLINGKEPRGRDVNIWSQMIDEELKKVAKKKTKTHKG